MAVRDGEWVEMDFPGDPRQTRGHSAVSCSRECVDDDVVPGRIEPSSNYWSTSHTSRPVKSFHSEPSRRFTGTRPMISRSAFS